MKTVLIITAFLFSFSTGMTQSVKIGNLQWMSRNLDVAFYTNGDPIPQVTDSKAWAGLTTGAWCYYKNDSTQGAKYGKLYNWYAVHDPRGLAPAGWHVPSDAEWTTLVTYLGGGAVAGGAMKETGTTHWKSPNSGATNSSGFTGLPGGYRNLNGAFYVVGNYGGWWSSSEDDTAYAWSRLPDYSSGRLYRSSDFKQFGFSVRCLRD